VADQDIADPPRIDDLLRVPTTLSTEQTNEIERVRRRFQFTVDGILLAALGRTIAHAIGDGVVAVNLAGDGRSVLRPDVDPRRTVGGFATIYPIPLTCLSRESGDAMHILDDVHDTLKAVPHHGIGHGLLKYLYAPTSRILGPIPPPDIYVSNEGMIPDLPSGEGPVQFDLDAAMPVRDKVAGRGHAIEIRIYRFSGVLHVDWWYDVRRVKKAQVETLAERFPITLTELVDEAIASTSAEPDLGGAPSELGLVDLSAE